MRAIGLDVGEQRIGVAVGVMIAAPHGVVRRTPRAGTEPIRLRRAAL